MKDPDFILMAVLVALFICVGLPSAAYVGTAREETKQARLECAERRP